MSDFQKDVLPMFATLAQERLKAALTQQQMANKIGVSRRTFIRWENGEYWPDLVQAALWARALGLRLELAKPGASPCA